MFSISIMMFILIIITSIVMMLASILSKKSLTDREKCSPFECGFDPKSSSRLPFFLRFFLITIIFFNFWCTMEIALILPMILIITISNIFMWTFTSIIFIIILIIGLYHEWNQSMLNWSN